MPGSSFASFAKYGNYAQTAPECNVIIGNTSHAQENAMSLSTTDKLIARKENGIGWVIFNQPEKRNAMTPEMTDSMRIALESYATDDEVRVVILRGEGDKAFVSGADISKFA